MDKKLINFKKGIDKQHKIVYNIIKLRFGGTKNENEWNRY